MSNTNKIHPESSHHNHSQSYNQNNLPAISLNNQIIQQEQIHRPARISKSSNKSDSSHNNKNILITQGQFTESYKFFCIFCGGKSCSKEDYKKNKFKNALQGLHSNWITNQILAMQRPSDRIIKEHNLIDQFKQNKIKAVFNLQIPGEHPYCGDGLQKVSGFTYTPEIFSNSGIYFFNISWEDMTVCDINKVRRIMELMDFIIKQGDKLSVHCHAGTGRTGLVIASYLIFYQNYTAEAAIKQFRMSRKGGLSKSKQVNFLVNFEKYIKENRIIFGTKIPLSLDQQVGQQQLITHGQIKKKSAHVPILQVLVFERMKSLVREEKLNGTQIFKSFTDPTDRSQFETPWDEYCEVEIRRLCKLLDEGDWECLWKFDVRVLAQTLLLFYERLKEPAISASTVSMIAKLQESHPDGEQFAGIFLEHQFLQQISESEFHTLNSLMRFVSDFEVFFDLGEPESDLLLSRFSVALHFDERNRIESHSLDPGKKSFVLAPETRSKIRQFSNYKLSGPQTTVLGFLNKWLLSIQDNSYNGSQMERIQLKYSHLYKNSLLLEGGSQQQQGHSQAQKQGLPPLDKNSLQKINPQNLIVGVYHSDYKANKSTFVEKLNRSGLLSASSGSQSPPKDLKRAFNSKHALPPLQHLPKSDNLEGKIQGEGILRTLSKPGALEEQIVKDLQESNQIAEEIQEEDTNQHAQIKLSQAEESIDESRFE